MSQQDNYGNDWQNSSQGDWISSAQPIGSNDDGGFSTSTQNDSYSQQSNSTFKCYEEHWSQYSSNEDSIWGARSSQENTLGYSSQPVDQFDTQSTGNRTNYTDYWMPPSQDLPIASHPPTPSYHSSYNPGYEQSQYSQCDSFSSSQNNGWNSIADGQASAFSNGDDTLSQLTKYNNDYDEKNNN